MKKEQIVQALKLRVNYLLSVAKFLEEIGEDGSRFRSAGYEVNKIAESLESEETFRAYLEETSALNRLC